MHLNLDQVMETLSVEFENLAEIFTRDDWKFYKFGQGGPYKRHLTPIRKLADKHDSIIIERYGISKEIATFGKLIVLSLAAVETPKQAYKNSIQFRKQIAWMKKVL